MSETKHEYATNKAWSGRGNLTQLVAELERQKESRIDFVVDTRALRTGESDNGQMLLAAADAVTAEWIPQTGLPVNDTAVGQLLQSTKPPIPVRFGRELLSAAPGTAAGLINRLWGVSPKRRLVRCLDDRVRAVLSDRYRVLDNYDLAFGALDVAKNSNAHVLEASLTDKSMCLKFVSYDVFHAIDERRNDGRGGWYAGGLGSKAYLSKVGARSTGELPGGPGTLHPVATIRNSEIGQGSLEIRVGILRAACFNLATVETIASEVHLGGRLDHGIYTLETQQKASEAQMLAIRDAVAAAFKEEHFKRMVERAQAAADESVAAPIEAIEKVCNSVEWSDDRKSAILLHFGAEAPTRWGVSQAIARAAQDATAEVAIEIEAVAGQVLDGTLALA